MCAGYRQQGYVSGPLDGLGYLPLMFGAIAGYPARNDFPTFTDKITESAGVLVIYGYLFIGAETANLPALERSLFPGTAASLWGSFVTHISSSSVFYSLSAWSSADSSAGSSTTAFGAAATGAAVSFSSLTLWYLSTLSSSLSRRSSSAIRGASPSKRRK